MTILQEDDGQRGSFYIDQDNERMAELAYSWREDHVVSIDHTEVDERLEGKGVGSALVERAVAFAREKNLRFILYCPFAQKVFSRKKEYDDVLNK